MLTKMPAVGLVAASSIVALPLASVAANEYLNDSEWTAQGIRALAEAEALQGSHSDRARNVILFVGDGMGVSTVTAARILEGQRRGQPGEENSLAFETFPHLALVKTYSVNQQTPDSAPTMTAMVTGVKTEDGLPYTTLSYANGAGHRAGTRPDLTDVDTTDLDFLQEATVPTGSATHAGEDVALYARGPGAQLVHGSQEQTISFYVMARALRLDGSRRNIWDFLAEWF